MLEQLVELVDMLIVISNPEIDFYFPFKIKKINKLLFFKKNNNELLKSLKNQKY